MHSMIRLAKRSAYRRLWSRHRAAAFSANPKLTQHERAPQRAERIQIAD
jgi:hypothetical protein